MVSKFAMRIWLDPEKLRTYSLMPSDVTNAIQSQNADVSSGSLGSLPAVDGQALSATVTSCSRLRTVEQFQEINLKSDGRRDVVRQPALARLDTGCAT